MTGQSLPLWVTIPGSVLLVIGGLATLLGSWGLVRFTNFFSRMHGASMTNTAGAGAVLVVSMLASTAIAHRPSLHEVLIALLVLTSAPVTSIVLLQAALYRNKARR